MANLNPGKFAHPEILSRVRKDLLLGWLRPMAEYFGRRGLALPGEDERGDYDRLARILMEPAPEMPPELLESLYVFREMDSETAMDAILGEAEGRGLGLGLLLIAT